MRTSGENTAERGNQGKKKPLIQPRLWVALFGVAVIVIAGSLFRVTRLYQTTSAQADKLGAELLLEQAEKERLTLERDYMTTSTYIEREARIEYGYIYPDDIRFVAALDPDVEADEDWYGEDFGETVAVFAP